MLCFKKKKKSEKGLPCILLEEVEKKKKKKEGKRKKRKDECFPLSLISVSESLRWSPRAGLPLPALAALGLPTTSQSSRPSERGHETGTGRETLHLAQTLPLLAWVSTVAHGSHKRWPSHTSSSLNKLIWTSLFLLTWEFDLLFVSVLNATCPVLYYGRIRVYVTLFAKKPGLKKKAVFLVMLGTQQSRVASVLTPLSHPKREWRREAREPRFQHPNKPPPAPAPQKPPLLKMSSYSLKTWKEVSIMYWCISHLHLRICQS